MRVQNIDGLPPTWLAVCDAAGCTAQESLIAERDAQSLAVLVPARGRKPAERELQIANAIATGRGWASFTGNGGHLCPAHASSTSVPLELGQVDRGR